MHYKHIQGVEKNISPIFFGTASPEFIKGMDQSDLLNSALRAGINAFDTARNYGLAEKALGLWLRKENVREQIVILSKCAHPNILGRKRVNETDIRKDFAKSTEYLGTDYIDIYLLHRDDTSVDVSVAVEVLNAMHAEGKIKAFGVSNWSCNRIQAANDYALKHNLLPFTISSPHFSLARQQADPWGGGCVSITGTENQDSRDWYMQNQMPILAYSALGRGILSGKLKSEDAIHADQLLDEAAMKGYGCQDNFVRLQRCEELAAKKGSTVAQLAMAWLYHQPMNTFSVVTMSSAKRLQENIDALSLDLSDQECRYLNLEEETYK